jgi:ankyrin repeat protein
MKARAGVVIGIVVACVVAAGAGAAYFALMMRRSAAEHAMLEAAASGDLEAVERMLADDPTLANASLKSGNTPLRQAAKKAHEEVVARLIAAGADVDARGHYGWTPLHAAALYDNKPEARRRVIEMLVGGGADPNARDEFRRTPLHLAVAEGSVSAAAELLARGADRDAVDMRGRTPADYASDGKISTETFAKLMPSVTGAEIVDAAAAGDLEAVKAMLAEDPALLDATAEGGDTALIAAAENGRAQVVAYLIDRGADVNTRGRSRRTPIHGVALDASDPDARRRIVKLLCDRGVNPDARDAGGRTPLHLAVAAGSGEVAAELLAWGAEAELADDEGKTPADYTSKGKMTPATFDEIRRVAREARNVARP